MDFKEFLPPEKEPEKKEIKGQVSKIGNNQLYEVVVGKDPNWRTIIYELIHTEQLDPWDIDIVLLTKRYFEKITEYEEADFYISSKVLLAAALLLRLKSEFLLNIHIQSIDEILFGKKEEVLKKETETIEIDNNFLPLLIPKTPLPRSRRVTLTELMNALQKAINTESRRIKREVDIKTAKKISEINLPEFKRTDLKERIKELYANILTNINKKAINNEKELNKITYNDLVRGERVERLACFLPLLHLSSTKKLWVEQENHLDEIWIYLYKYFENNPDSFIEELKEDIEDMKEELENIPEEDSFSEEKEERKQNFKDRIKEKRELQNKIKEELEKELSLSIEKNENEQKIDDVTEFSDEEF